MELCVRITWTNRSEGKPDLGVDQYLQYRITLKIESTLSPFLQLYKSLEFRSVKRPKGLTDAFYGCEIVEKLSSFVI